MVFFTDNYQDRSSDDGYQFEFFCRRCGNGYSSSFQHSVTGFGGRLLRLGGDMLGGQLGERASQLGWDAEFMRDTVRGSTRDKALAKAVEEMQPYFKQCHNCGQWVCDQICWNTERGLCVSCAPKLDQAMAHAGPGAGRPAEPEDPGAGLDEGHQLPRPGRPACARRAGRRAAGASSARRAATRWPRAAVGEEILRELWDFVEWGEVLRRVRHPG